MASMSPFTVRIHFSRRGSSRIFWQVGRSAFCGGATISYRRYCIGASGQRLAGGREVGRCAVRGQHDPIIRKHIYLIGGDRCSHDCDGGRCSLVTRHSSLATRGRGAFSSFNLRYGGEDSIFRGYLLEIGSGRCCSSFVACRGRAQGAIQQHHTIPRPTLSVKLGTYRTYRTSVGSCAVLCYCSERALGYS